MSEQWLKLSEVVQSDLMPNYSLSKKYQIVRYLIAEGKLPFYNFGRSKSFKKSDIVLALEQEKTFERVL